MTFDPREDSLQSVSAVESVRAADPLVSKHVYEQEASLLSVRLDCSTLDGEAVAFRCLLVGGHSHVPERPPLRHRPAFHYVDVDARGIVDGKGEVGAEQRRWLM